jgi:hypothetical protein
MSQKTCKHQRKQIEFCGKSQSLHAWARELNINYDTLYVRVNRLKWDIERAFTVPVAARRRLSGAASRSATPPAMRPRTGTQTTSAPVGIRAEA